MLELLTVKKSLRKQFATPKAAEVFFAGAEDDSDNDCEVKQSPVPSMSKDYKQDVELSDSGSINIFPVDTMESTLQSISMMELDEHLQLTNESFQAYCSRVNVSVPQDFLHYAVQGMIQLNTANRSNFLYALDKGLGTQRCDGKDSVFPTKQVVTRLVEHCANFFNSTFIDEVRLCMYYIFVCVVVVVGGTSFTQIFTQIIFVHRCPVHQTIECGFSQCTPCLAING